MRLRRRPLLGVLLAFCIGGAGGQGLTDEVILTVENPLISNGSGKVAFTRMALESLPQHTIVTTTEFTDGTKTFMGPRLLDVLGMIGNAGATELHMVAANDFAVDVDMEAVLKYDPILAMRMDGEVLSLRDKGPLWVMYPIDSHTELKDPVYNSWLIWQLTTIILR